MLRRLNPLLLAAVHRPWCTRLMAPPQHRTVTPEPIHTDRLALLPLAVEHAEEMALALADPGLHTFIGGAPADASALRVRYERLVAGPADPSASWCNWTIELRAEKCLVGTVQATVTGGTGERVAEIAWVVGTPWQGRGVATEAVQGLVAWLARQSVHSVIAHIHPKHLASMAVATAAGLTPTTVWHEGEVRWMRVGRASAGQA
jgi:RimJ/RimL family protein N-acetyltransferase